MPTDKYQFTGRLFSTRSGGTDGMRIHNVGALTSIALLLKPADGQL